jgi:protease-4
MNRLRVAATLGLVFSLSAFHASVARAQFPLNQPTRLPAFGKSPVSNDDSTSLVQNPANLAFLPASELRWSSVYLNESARAPWQGHAFAFAFPIPFLNASTGIRADVMSPPRGGVGQLFQSDGAYQWITWGLAIKASNSVALGTTLQRSYSTG